MVLWFDWAQLTMFPRGTLEVLCEAAVNGGWGWSHQEDHLDAGLAGSLSLHLNSSSLHTAFLYDLSTWSLQQGSQTSLIVILTGERSKV